MFSIKKSKTPTLILLKNSTAFKRCRSNSQNDDLIFSVARLQSSNSRPKKMIETICPSYEPQLSFGPLFGDFDYIVRFYFLQIKPIVSIHCSHGSRCRCKGQISSVYSSRKSLMHLSAKTLKC